MTTALITVAKTVKTIPESLKGSKKAKDAFASRISEKAGELLNTRPFAMGMYLEHLNSIIESGINFEVTGAKSLTEDEIKDLAEELKHMCELKLRDDMAHHLKQRLWAKGLEEEFVEEFPKLVKPE